MPKYSSIEGCPKENLAYIPKTVLKEACQDLSLSTAGTKEELCARLMAALPKNIGQGTYGCVYKSPIPCAEDWEGAGKPNIVSKWMRKQAAEEEVAEHRKFKLHEIEGSDKWSISKPHMCTPNKKVLKHVPPCSVMSDGVDDSQHVDDSKLLMYADGGISLSETLGTTSLKDVLVGLKNVFLGISVMNKRGIYHLDLKPANIVVKDGMYRIIDFGLSQELKTHPELPELYTQTYYIWPPELTFLAEFILGNIDLEADDEIDSMIGYIASDYNADFWVVRYHHADDYDASASKTSSTSKYLRELYDLYREGGEYYDIIATKLDVYGLGTLLMEVITTNASLSNSSPSPAVFLKTKKFVDEKKLLSHNPRERPTPTALYKEYVKFVDGL